MEDRKLLTRCEIALEAAKAGTWLLDLKENIVDIDNCLCKILETDQYIFSLDEAIDLFVHNGDKKRVRAHLEKAIKESGEYDIDFRIMCHRSGGLKNIHAKGKVLYDINGEPDNVIGMCIDFSERKKAQEQLDDFISVEMNIIKNRVKHLIDGYDKVKK